VKLSDLRPGWRTDFIIHRFGGEVIERDDCIVVRTPANPNFYWGNFLLLPQAPADGELAHWLARFEHEIGSLQPLSRHVAIGINAAPSAEPLPAWAAAGFEIDETAVIELTAGELRAPPRPARGRVELRALDLARELDAVVEQQSADPDGYDPAGFTDFRRREMQRFSRIAAHGTGCWFGLWCDGVLAADCGLIRDQHGPGATGRFQHVGTHPAWRRRGLCTALVHAVTTWGFQHWPLQRIVMCADPHDVALDIYRGLGYQPIDSEGRLQRRAPQDLATA